MHLGPAIKIHGPFNPTHLFAYQDLVHTIEPA